MLSIAALAGFCLAVAPMVLTPGASFTLVSARGAVGDRRGAWATIGGTAAGILTHALIAGIGLAAIVMRSAEIYATIRLLGAAYLVILGAALLWQSVLRRSKPGAAAPARAPRSAGHHGRLAFVANVLNVKAASVYLTLAPQFIPAEAVGVAPMLLLALVHVGVMAAWLGLWATGLTAAAIRFDTAAWQRGIQAVGGAILVALGIRTAAAARG